MELTGTNQSTGLTTLDSLGHFGWPHSASRLSGLINDRIVLGDHSDGETPVPIPNTEVKPVSADGTARTSVGE